MGSSLRRTLRSVDLFSFTPEKSKRQSSRTLSVMYEFVTNSSTTWATSSGWPKRPTGIRSCHDIESLDAVWKSALLTRCAGVGSLNITVLAIRAGATALQVFHGKQAGREMSGLRQWRCLQFPFYCIAWQPSAKFRVSRLLRRSSGAQEPLRWLQVRTFISSPGKWSK